MRSPETIFDWEGMKMLKAIHDELPRFTREGFGRFCDGNRSAIVDFVRTVQEEAYRRGKVDGLQEGLKIGPNSEAGAVLASLVKSGDYP